MHSAIAAARQAMLDYHQHNSTAGLVKKTDPYSVSASFLVTLLLPFLTLVYLELLRIYVPTPVAVKKYPEVHYASSNGDETAIVKTVQVAQILNLVYLELSRIYVPTPVAVKKYPEVHYASSNGDETAIVKTVQVAQILNLVYLELSRTYVPTLVAVKKYPEVHYASNDEDETAIVKTVQVAQILNLVYLELSRIYVPTPVAMKKYPEVHYASNDEDETAIVKTVQVAQILNLVYLELSRTYVATPVAVKKYPGVHYASNDEDETAIVKTVQVAHTHEICTQKLIWVESSPHLGSRQNLSNISKLEIVIPATDTVPLTPAVRRTSMSPIRASFRKPAMNETEMAHEECLLKLVEETLTYFQANRPVTEELHRLIPKLEQFTEWNSVRSINSKAPTSLIEYSL
ncbi:hypothetical protein BGW37DRAFT_465993 [Umbelopsis sp. PMI_123]|nr:hypothetical protein BGW37DRAFT_465993 [Umbelopsis sp. PMI_123]